MTSTPRSLCRLASLLGSIAATSCGDGGTTDPTPEAVVCSHPYDQQCARVAGTVRDAEGRPIEGAVMQLVSDSANGSPFNGETRTDASGHFLLEASFTDLTRSLMSSPVTSLRAHLRGTVENGVSAVDASVLLTVPLAQRDSTISTVTADLVIEGLADWPATPSGRIAFVGLPPNQASGGLYLINADGQGEVPIHLPGDYDQSPDWSPDGQTLLFSAGGKLERIDADGSNLRDLGLNGFKPRWSPDGGQFAFLARYDDDLGHPHNLGAWLAQPDGTAPRRLPSQDDDSCAKTCSSLTVDGGFEWYSNPDRLAYFVYTLGAMDVYSGAYATRISDSIIEPLGGAVPIWAPDGSRYATTSYNLIQIFQPDGVRVGVIPRSGYPTWSPDSQWLAYASSGLWIADASGNRRRRIALIADDPDWQPTGP